MEKTTEELILDQLRYLTSKTEETLTHQEALKISHEKLKWKVMALSASVAYLAHHGIEIAKAFWP